MELFHILLSTLLLLAPGIHAQFNFFGNMFNQQQQPPSNVASDSDWYRQNYEGGEDQSSLSLNHTLPANSHRSALRQIPLPAYAQLRTLPTSLPLRVSCAGGESRVRRRQYGVREQRRVQRGRRPEKDRIGTERLIIDFVQTRCHD